MTRQRVATRTMHSSAPVSARTDARTIDDGGKSAPHAPRASVAVWPL
jgi:hypothetical protein